MAQDRHRSISRRDLARHPRFVTLSPALGQLDEEAVATALADDADETLALLAQASQATDRALAERARRLAGRLLLDLARDGPTTPGAGRRLRQLVATDDSLDLDLDASLDGLLDARAQRRAPTLDDLVATRWEHPGTAYCLLIDRSGSMSGERLATAALAAAVCTLRCTPLLAVHAFGQQVIELKAMDDGTPASTVVEAVLGLRGHGTTDLAAALRAAHRSLEASGARRRVTILLSDTEATTGADPLPVARSLDELLVVAPADADEPAGTFARTVAARLGLVEHPGSVLATLGRLLSRADAG